MDLHDTPAKDLGDAIREMTDGRGSDALIDAVGMEAHGSPGGKIVQTTAALMPDAMAQKVMEKAGVDRLAALHSAVDIVRRGGTISIIGVYGGTADPMPMLTMFDKQLTVRMGPATGFRSPRARTYEIFQKKQDGACKIVLTP